ncbi:MAG: type II toxin-antitoxin system HicB family antitoxin [Saprospiraceae bacterium]|nr:type II toxin-antitoxin system HicB family antitoxin [Saprospiraceae bacterium]MBP7642959.1 type II toxin-antitoxin system HicB family antitoxin [Saprospiraceae bacterium]HMS69805.1 type II toxin-antitoxin system HicB family antitoxin [Saprospiraceae bacterium]
MKNLEYKGYTGTIEYSHEDQLFYGKVIGIKSLISYEGATGPELEADFKESIDDYLSDCVEMNIKSEKPFKGSFNVRIPTELHKEAAIKAQELNTSLNSFVAESIRARLLGRL